MTGNILPRNLRYCKWEAFCTEHGLLEDPWGPFCLLRPTCKIAVFSSIFIAPKYLRFHAGECVLSCLQGCGLVHVSLLLWPVCSRCPINTHTLLILATTWWLLHRGATCYLPREAVSLLWGSTDDSFLCSIVYSRGLQFFRLRLGRGAAMPGSWLCRKTWLSAGMPFSRTQSRGNVDFLNLWVFGMSVMQVGIVQNFVHMARLDIEQKWSSAESAEGLAVWH